MARRSSNSMRDRIGFLDRTRFALVIGLMLLVGVTVLPRVYPAAQLGPQCTNLAAPIGGNNRSVLAQAGGDQQELDLELRLESRVITTEEPLVIHLTFANRDIGPVILYLTDATPPLTRLENDTGVSFEIRRVGTDQPLTDNAAPRGAPQSYPSDQLHLLGSRTRCTQTYRYTAQQLSAIGLQPGEYRIRAFYRNPSSGVLPPPASGQPPTATPAYTDQGVWVGQASSEEVLFSVVTPGSLPPAS